MRRAILIALLGASAGLPGTALAADRYASASTTRETGSCTAFAPCTLPYAASVAQAGETVRVAPGTYTVAGDLLLTPGVRLSGIGAERPLIKTGGTIRLTGASAQQRAVANGIEIEGRLYLGAFADGDEVVVRNGSGFNAVAVSADAVLRNSLVVTSGNTTDAVAGNSSTPGLVLNSTLIAKGAGAYAASAVGDVDDHDGICSAFPSSLELKNVIARGGKADLRAEGEAGYDCQAQGTIEVSSSNFRTTLVSPSNATITSGAGNQTTPALTDDAAIFADTTLFRQREGAPTHDAGAADALVAGLDLDGEARVLGAAVDIGADELPPPPLAETLAAADVAQTAATLQARVTPNAADTTVVFEYGVTGAYGTRTTAQLLPAGSPATTVHARVEGLAPGTTFHYRVLAFNAGGAQPRSATGAGATFATLQPPPVVAPPLIPLPDLLTGLTAKRSVNLKTFGRKGLAVAFTLGRPGTAYAVKLTARLGKRTVTLARAAGTAGPGLRSLKLKPSKKTAGRLRRFKRAKAKLTVSAGTAVATRTVTIRR